jgi:ABC-type transport system involved in multi-copper enzyme maturation permease subunit
MLAAIKSEFRKLFTIRSTYVWTAISIVLLGIFAFWAQGYKANSPVTDAGYLASQSVQAMEVLGMLLAIIAVLSITQEYRFNTIMYTLTASSSRAKVLAAKIISMSVFAVAFAALFGTLSPLFTLVGLHFGHVHMVHQNLELGSTIWRTIFDGWGMAMIALLLAALIRNQIGAIVALFLLPGTIEGLLGSLVLHNNQNYLPFTTLGQVAEHVMVPIRHGSTQTHIFMSYGHAAIQFTAYLVVAWAVAFILFVKRDAN